MSVFSVGFPGDSYITKFENIFMCLAHSMSLQGVCAQSIGQSVPLLSHVWLFVTPWTAACQASLSINSQSLLKLMSIKSVIPSNHLILCHPLLPSVFPSIRFFSNESALGIRWPKYWSFSFNISPSNEHPGLISFRMDWLHLLAVQGTLKSLLQHHSSKASILRGSAFLIVQLSHSYMTTGETIALKALTSRLAGTSLAVQWLKLAFQCTGCGFRSLVGELTSHRLRAKKSKYETEVIL